MVACVAHAGKAFLGGTSGCRLSLCSLVHPWWSVAFPWVGTDGLRLHQHPEDQGGPG